jgi:hypothetical protein
MGIEKGWEAVSIPLSRFLCLLATAFFLAGVEEPIQGRFAPLRFLLYRQDAETQRGFAGGQSPALRCRRFPSGSRGDRVVAPSDYTSGLPLT